MDDMMCILKNAVIDIWNACLDYWWLTLIVGTLMFGPVFFVVFGLIKLVLKSKENRESK